MKKEEVAAIGSAVKEYLSKKIHIGMLFGAILIFGAGCMEVWNWSTTNYGIQRIIGNMVLEGSWSVAQILAIGVCCIDLAGIARVFTPESGNKEQEWVTWLFIGWLLASILNSLFTWWSVSIMMVTDLPSYPIPADDVRLWAPIFIAGFTLFVRILIITTIAMAGDKLFAKPAETSIIGSMRARHSMPAHDTAPFPVH